MTTEELIERLPKVIEKYPDEERFDSIDECVVGRLRITVYETYYDVCYRDSHNILYLGTEQSPDYAIASQVNLNDALQNMYDWCVKHKLIQL